METPDYYKGDGTVTCMDALRSCVHGWKPDPLFAFWFCNAFKYLWRFKGKDGLKDLYKCRNYINMMIDRLEQVAYPMGAVTRNRRASRQVR